MQESKRIKDAIATRAQDVQDRVNRILDEVSKVLVDVESLVADTARCESATPIDECLAPVDVAHHVDTVYSALCRDREAVKKAWNAMLKLRTLTELRDVDQARARLEERVNDSTDALVACVQSYISYAPQGHAMRRFEERFACVGGCGNLRADLLSYEDCAHVVCGSCHKGMMKLGREWCPVCRVDGRCARPCGFARSVVVQNCTDRDVVARMLPR